MLRFLFAFAALISAWTLSSTPSHAMEIRPGIPGLCVATLSGPIRNGDLAKLQNFSPDAPADWTNLEEGQWKSLCLDSPGGSYTEAFRISQHMIDVAFGTVINENAECLSACALIFMFGTAYQHESNSLTHRRLHVNGKLGFHQPELPLDPNRNYSVADVRAAFDVAIESTLRFLALAARPRPDSRRPFIDSDLQEAMLQHKGQTFFMIDTVNKAGRWDIALFGFDQPAFNEQVFFNACQNMTTWPARLAGEQRKWGNNNYDYSLNTERWTAGGLTRDRYNLEFAQMQTYDCAGTVAQHWTGDTLSMLCGFREDTNVSVGTDDCDAPDQLYSWAPIPAHAMFPASTKLADLASGAALPKNTAKATTLPNPCVSEKGLARVINVKNFTSLRQSTGFNTPKIDELPLGTTYATGKTATIDPQYAGHSACFQLCQLAGQNQPYDQAALGQCIQDNWMWFRITGPSGRVGYASAKFLDY